jgi:hypothetical protein
MAADRVLLNYDVRANPPRGGDAKPPVSDPIRSVRQRGCRQRRERQVRYASVIPLLAVCMVAGALWGTTRHARASADGNHSGRTAGANFRDLCGCDRARRLRRGLEFKLERCSDCLCFSQQFLYRFDPARRTRRPLLLRIHRRTIFECRRNDLSLWPSGRVGDCGLYHRGWHRDLRHRL